MPMRTTAPQRRAFFERYRNGETYQALAGSAGVSPECVRYWCRRQRDGRLPDTQYRRTWTGQLHGFDPKVRYAILYLRLKHPGWGPNRILEALKTRCSVRRLRLPSEASIGRYLHQWPRFRRRPQQKTPRERPEPPTAVHQRWQIDFKLGIALTDGSLVNLHTVRDPVGEACLAAVVFPAGRVGQPPERVSLDQVRWVLRRAFVWWGMPDQVQTDGETVLVDLKGDFFPSVFSLWLVGLAIRHRVIRSGKPTDNAEVERCHRTLNEYAIIGNEDAGQARLQAVLDDAVYKLAFDLPSRAPGCAGRPPAFAHPELLETRRPYRPEHEWALFDLRRVDAYLARFTWHRKVGKTGQICIGGHHEYYSVGRAYAGQEILVRFDPADRHFVFYTVEDPDTAISRRPARGLEVADLTGSATCPPGLGPQQLPLAILEGVDC